MKKGISEAVLKNVAVITMTIDHVTAYILKEYLRNQGITSLYTSDLYTAGRIIGRIAFVLYAFMIAEGAAKTSNKVKYAGRLLLLAVISIVPRSYVSYGTPFSLKVTNIFFLLFLGLITIYGWQWLKDNISRRWLSLVLQTALIAASCAVAMLTKMEYGMMGILLIMVFYIFRNDFPKLAISGALVMSVGYIAHCIITSGAQKWLYLHRHNLINDMLSLDKIQIFGLLAFPLIFFYNGEKGRQLPKWFYYFFYPVHLGIIAVIVQFM